jgi:hypothetical protein
VGDLVETGGGAPALPPNFEKLDKVWGRIDEARTASATAFSPSAQLLSDLDAVIDLVGRHAGDIQAAAAPISKGDLAIHLGLLFKSFPNAGVQDARIFGKMMRDDVLSLQPTVGAIDLGCRRWRRKSKFLPAIAEMMEEVRSAQSQIEGAVDFVRRLPALRADMARKLSSL